MEPFSSVRRRVFMLYGPFPQSVCVNIIMLHYTQGRQTAANMRSEVEVCLLHGFFKKWNSTRAGLWTNTLWNLPVHKISWSPSLLLEVRYSRYTANCSLIFEAAGCLKPNFWDSWWVPEAHSGCTCLPPWWPVCALWEAFSISPLAGQIQAKPSWLHFGFYLGQFGAQILPIQIERRDSLLSKSGLFWNLRCGEGGCGIWSMVRLGLWVNSTGRLHIASVNIIM